MRRPAPSVRRALGAAALVTGAAVTAPIVVAVALAAAAFESSPGPAQARVPDAAGLLPGPPAGAFSVPPPAPLRPGRAGALWASVRHGVAARVAPGGGAPVVARLSARTPEGTAGIVAVVGRSRDADGRPWTRVRLPVLPNGTTGWVPRDALGGYGVARARLVVDTRRLRATLWRDGRVVFRAPVGVGRPRSPTPRGDFLVRNVLTRYRSAFYGPAAFGTSARSAVLTDWPAGGFIGIHGTDRPDLIPGRVSHGCIRLRNADVLRLARLMPTGTPITIR